MYMDVIRMYIRMYIRFTSWETTPGCQWQRFLAWDLISDRHFISVKSWDFHSKKQRPQTENYPGDFWGDSGGSK